MSSTHPKPWTTENTLPLVPRKGLENGLWTIKDGTSKPFCAMFDEQAAIEIVAAVNSHSDLLAACEAAVEAIEEHVSDEPKAPAWAAKLHQQLEAAIAKARANS